MSNTQTPVHIEPKDLPLHCHGAQTETWNGHPSVNLPIESNGQATCPYCGTVFQLNGEIKSHH